MTYNNTINLIPEFLRNSETYYLILTDLEGKYIFVNEVFNKRFSFVCDNFIGQPSFIAIYPEDHGKCLQAVNQCFANPSQVVKIRLRKPDTNLNDFFWTQWEFSLFKDQHQNPIGILCLGHDISETEKASLQAKEFAQKVETIIEEITDGFYVLNREWEFVKINKVAEQILGIPREKLLRRKIWDLFPDTPDYNYPTAYRKAMNEYVTVTFEDYLSVLDRWFSTVCYPSPEGLTVFFKDTTQERKTKEKLKYSESKLRAILDSTTDTNILISPDYKILSFNKQANEVSQVALGKPLKELADMWEYVLPNDKENFYRDTQKALKGEYLKFEKEIFFENFSVWFEVSYFPVYDNEGKMLGITFNTTNINARKKAETQLKQSENKLRAILDSTTDSNILISPDYEILCFNERANKKILLAYGKPFGEMADVWEYIPSQNKESFYDSTQKALKGEYLTFEKEIFFDRLTAWCELAYYPAYDSEGKILGVTFNVTNIDARKKAEIQLKQSETMLTALYDSRSEASTFIDRDFRILFNNRIAKQISMEVFGKEAQKGDKSLDFMIPELQDEFYDYYKRVLEGESIQIEKEHKGKWWRFSLYPVYDNDNNVIGISNNVKDVTGRVQNELKIRKQNESLRQIAWQQSHEVRRPVATILGLYDLLKNDETATEAEKQKYLDYLLQATEELDKVIHKIVGYTQDIE